VIDCADQTDQTRGRAGVRQLRSRYSDGRPSRYFYWDDLPGRLSAIMVPSFVSLTLALIGRHFFVH
jgi:hypothetical protein